MKRLFALILVYLLTPTAWALASPTSGARSQMCQDLFDTGELEKSIRGLAKLRMQLDVAKAHANGSLSFATLDSQYKEKEQSILGHALKNNLMSQADFFKMISLEIATLQTDESKIETEKDQQNQGIKETIPGARAEFHKVFSNDGAFEIMSTPVTERIWQKIVQLGQLSMTNSSPNNGELFPKTYISYNQIVEWLMALNRLSKNFSAELGKIIPDHQPGDVYELPSESQWEIFLNEASAPAGIEKVNLRSLEEVHAQNPFYVQGKAHYGLRHALAYFLKETRMDGDTRVVKTSLVLCRTFEGQHTAASFRHEHLLNGAEENLTFRLVRIRPTP